MAMIYGPDDKPKKPKWWTGRWLLKAVLIWLAGFLIWYPVFSKWPNSIAARLATILFGLTMLPLMVGYGAGVLGDWIRLLRRLKRESSA